MASPPPPPPPTEEGWEGMDPDTGDRKKDKGKGKAKDDGGKKAGGRSKERPGLIRRISSRTAKLLKSLKKPQFSGGPKANSTSSIFLTENTGTLKNPDMREMVQCVALAMKYHVKRGKSTEHKTFIDIFDEEKHPIAKTVPKNTTENDIANFIAGVAGAVDLTPECCVLCLVFVERLICLTGLTIADNNWRRLLLGTMALASKIWIDLSMWNVDFVNIIPDLDISDMNKMENELVALLQFNVSVKASLYAKYFFELKSFSKGKKLPDKPLSKEAASKLEHRSLALEDNYAAKHKDHPQLRRSKSEGPSGLKSSSTPASIRGTG